jgi:uncharacterized membrane protein
MHAVEYVSVPMTRSLEFSPQSIRQAGLQPLQLSAQQPALALFAVGMIGLGVLALVFGDFALVWQPVAPWIPGRTALAYLSGLIMLFGGVGLFFRATVAWSVRLLFVYLIVWQLLKVPALFAAPTQEGPYLSFGESAALLAGGWILFARLAALPERSSLGFLLGDRSVRWAQLYFAVWIIPVGLSHFVYTKATFDLVPAWLPFRMGWGYLAGAGHIACGLGVLFSVFPRVAAWAEAGMISLFTLLVWGPAIASQPMVRLPWTAFFISWAIAAAVWVIATSTAPKQRPVDRS